MEPRSGVRHLKHVFRVVLLFVVLIVSIVLGRSLFVPESWGRYGWYRADNLAEQKDLPVRHGGDESCQKCHQEEFDARGQGGHKAVRCEVCHAPLVTHADEKVKTADMRTNKTVDLCATCHRKLAARPATFPQIELRAHVEGWGMQYGEGVCFTCHANPHKPL